MYSVRFLAGTGEPRSASRGLRFQDKFADLTSANRDSAVNAASIKAVY